MAPFDTITFSNVSAAYGETPVLSEFSAVFKAGVAYSITGRSGSGKSTLLSLASGIVFPASGSVMWGVHDTRKIAEHARQEVYRDTLRFLFQYHYLLDELTVAENIALPRMLARGVTQLEKGELESVEELLTLFKLADVRQAYPQFLSGGQRQRVALARALSSPGRFLLADEPTGELDRDTGAQLMEYLFAYCRRIGMGVLFVTHDEGLAAQADVHLHIADRRIATRVLKQ